MTPESVLRRAISAVVVLAVLALLLGHLLGQPILLGYVATGSMEPTMDAGDGFVAIPSALTGSPEPGDVVVFEAAELHGGGLTTHRIVGVTDEGYVTKGDANPFTDQDGGEPPVTDGQIVASALQLRGDVVTIPHLGTAVTSLHGTLERGYATVASALGVGSAPDGEGIGAMLVAIGVALLGLGFLFDAAGPARRDVTRSTVRENVIAMWFAIALVLIVLVTLATAAMVIPSGVHEYGVVSTDEPTDDPQVLAPGETSELTRTIDNAGVLPIVVVYDAQSRGIEARPDRVTVGSRATGETTLTLTAPETMGTYGRHVSESRYLMVLPPSVLAWLHGIHPLVAIAAVDTVIVGCTVALMLALFGSGDLRVRRPGQHVSLRTRLERKLRKRF